MMTLSFKPLRSHGCFFGSLLEYSLQLLKHVLYEVRFLFDMFERLGVGYERAQMA